MNPNLALDSDDWIIGGPAVNVFPPDDGRVVEYDGDKDIEPRDPSKHEKAWHISGGNPELRETGTSIPPEPDEARGVILSVAQSELGWDQSQIRSVRNDQRTNLFFDYVTEGNYSASKDEIDYIVSDTDLITESEGQVFKDALDGKL